jgi:glycerol kinase
MQFQSDLIGIPVIRPENIETTALGAAYLAGLATGFWGSVEEISEQWAMDRNFSGKVSAEKRHALKKEWEKAVSRSRSWQDPAT